MKLGSNQQDDLASYEQCRSLSHNEEERISKKLDNYSKRTDIMSKVGDIILRGTLATGTTFIVYFWLRFIKHFFTVTVVQNKIVLDSSVLITLLTTTTITVLGLMTIVLKGLFPKQ